MNSQLDANEAVSSLLKSLPEGTEIISLNRDIPKGTILLRVPGKSTLFIPVTTGGNPPLRLEIASEDRSEVATKNPLEKENIQPGKDGTIGFNAVF